MRRVDDMALREIITVGSQDENTLRKVCREVAEVNDRIRTLLDDMVETMRFEGRGVGLAAPQIGVLRRIFVADIGDETGLLEFINPEIIKREGEVVSEEGCLSVPGETGKVLRPEKLTIKALDRNGNSFTIEAEDFLAVCISHEYDHLDGILYTDKLIEEEENEEA